MARLFDSSNDFLSADTGSLGAEPFTIVCWFRPNEIDVSNTLVWYGDKDTTGEFHTLELTTAEKLSCKSVDAGSSAGAISGSIWSVNTWNHAGGVWTAFDSRAVFLNGVKNTNATGKSVSGEDRISVGRDADSTPSGFFGGDIAEVAFWNVALTDNEMKTLAAGVSPLRVRPSSLQGYWPVNGSSPEVDLSGNARNLTVTGPVLSDHAPVSPAFGISDLQQIQSPPTTSGARLVESMGYLGDLLEDVTLRFTWSTNDGSGASVTRATNGTISVYKDGGTSQSTAGITDTEDFDGLTGVHLCIIDTSADAFYATGSHYSVVLSAATIDGKVVNVTLAEFSIENRFDEVDVTKVSGDATAADNLKLQYDTTGLSGDNFPAQQHQVADLAVTGSAIHVSAESYVLTTGTQSLNTVSDTGPLDGTNHEHTDVGNAMELYYQFDVTADGVATSCTVNGYLNSNNDDLEVYAFNWGTTTFERIGTLDGQNSATNGEHDYILFTAHTGTGSDNGKVRIRFFDGAFTLSSATLAIDQIFVSYAVVRQTVGYALGRIWINTALSNTNTVDFVDGTAENPVSTLAAAKTLSTSLGLSDFQIINGSTIALAETSDNESYFGDNWTLDLSDESCASAHFEGPTVSGLQTGADCSFVGGETGTVTLAADAHLHGVALGAGTITLPVGAVSFDRCHHSGTTAPILEFGTAVGSTTVHMHGYAGGIELNNFGDNGTDILFLDGNGKLIINNTNTGTDGTIHLRGHWEVDDQSTGSLVINYDDQSIVGTKAELTSAPAALSSIVDKITYLFMLARNKMTQSSTTQTLLADDTSTTVSTSAVSQSGGVTTRDEAS